MERYYILLLVVAFIVLISLGVIGIVFGLKNKEKISQSEQSHLDFQGEVGEIRAKYTLRRLLKKDEFILTNLLIPNWKNKTEIDIVIISRKGIFCIEVKNWVGVIIGNDEDEFFTQKPYFRAKNSKKIKNPVIQNDHHCKALSRLIPKKFDVYNVVLFVGEANINNIDSGFCYTFRRFEKDYLLCDDELTINEINQIYNVLNQYVVTHEELENFRNQQKEKYKNQS